MARFLQQLPSWCCFHISADFWWHWQNGKSNRTTFISDALETWSLRSLSSLFLYTWRQLLLFYSGICNRRENTRWFAKWRGIKLCQVLSGVYSQTHTPISQTVSLQYFSTKTKSGARCIIMHFFMDCKLPMYSNAFVLVIRVLLFLKRMLVRQNLAAICQQWKC